MLAILIRHSVLPNLRLPVGDLEGAVAALERMLIIEPDLPQVRMQLGTLYFQLGSLRHGLAYLNAVVAHEEVPEDVKQRRARTDHTDRRGEPRRTRL